MKSFSEKEQFCSSTFKYGGPFWHAYTDGRDSPMLFITQEDFAFAMNVIAQAAAAYPKMKIMAFEVMDNHFHFIVSSPDKQDIITFYEFIRKRISRSIPGIKSTTLSLKAITDLQALRNTIVYVHRNGFVPNPDYTPFSYPWGTGRYYFSDFPVPTYYSDIFTAAKRKMFRGRDPKLPENWKIIEGYIAPTSYCAIEYGMSMFRDAHNYFDLLYKKVEEYSEIAVGINDNEYLSDKEVYDKLQVILKDNYNLTSANKLTDAQKKDVATTLHYEFRSSNGQICRLLYMKQYDVNNLFPLCKK